MSINNSYNNVSNDIIFQAEGPFNVSDNYCRMAPYWQQIYDTLQNTQYMRSKGETYLPKEPRETDAAYKVRLQRSSFSPFFKDGVNTLVSKPFGQEIKVENGDFDPRIDSIEHNTDLLGSNLTEFFKDVMTCGIRYGMAHILVDMPSVPLGQSLAEENAIGARPNFKMVNPYDLIWYDTINKVDGSTVLSEVHIKEVMNVNGTEELFVRKYLLDSWELWMRDNKSGEWVMVDAGVQTLGEIPLLTYYTGKTSFLSSEAPLYSATEYNIVHWQSYSDQRNILTHTRVALLFYAGAAEEETDITVSVNNLITSSNENASLQYVEHSGAGTKAGWEDLAIIKQNIAEVFGSPETTRTGSVTATESVIKESRASSDLLAWTQALSATIHKCYKVAAKWLNIELPDDFKVSVFDNWVVSGSTEDLAKLNDLYDRGIISKETLLAETNRRGLFANGFSVEDEMNRVEEEAGDGTLFIDSDDTEF